jgi:acyl-CoA thioesterase-1
VPSLIRWILLLVWFAAGPVLAEPAVILVFGDSLSAGYGLPQGRGWVDLLQRRLAAEGLDYRVVNASISGETTLGGRNRLAAALEQHRPQIVVLELGSNDGLRGQPLNLMRDNLAAMVKASRAAGARVLIAGMRIPPNYGPKYTTEFHSIFQDVARSQRTALVPFLLDGFAERRELFQADGIHPDEAAQPLILDTLWKSLRPMLSPARRDSLGSPR